MRGSHAGMPQRPEIKIALGQSLRLERGEGVDSPSRLCTSPGLSGARPSQLHALAASRDIMRRPPRIVSTLSVTKKLSPKRLHTGAAALARLRFPAPCVGAHPRAPTLIAFVAAKRPPIARIALASLGAPVIIAIEARLLVRKRRRYARTGRARLGHIRPAIVTPPREAACAQWAFEKAYTAVFSMINRTSRIVAREVRAVACALITGSRLCREHKLLPSHPCKLLALPCFLRSSIRTDGSFALLSCKPATLPRRLGSSAFVSFALLSCVSFALLSCRPVTIQIDG